MTCTPAHRLLAEHLRHPPRVDTVAAFLISIKPRYARMIERGEKAVEFRRRFPANLSTAKAIFYLTSPVRQITMTARVARIERAAPRALWRQFAETAGTTRQEFDAYFAGAPRGVALVLDQVQCLPSPLHLRDVERAVLDFRPPRSLAVVPGDSPLLELLADFQLAPAARLA